jgi:hypothetical protein
VQLEGAQHEHEARVQNTSRGMLIAPVHSAGQAPRARRKSTN